MRPLRESAACCTRLLTPSSSHRASTVSSSIRVLGGAQQTVGCRCSDFKARLDESVNVKVLPV
jgi:hypothetical protein